jgi:hypothetical protein
MPFHIGPHAAVVMLVFIAVSVLVGAAMAGAGGWRALAERYPAPVTTPSEEVRYRFSSIRTGMRWPSRDGHLQQLCDGRGQHRRLVPGALGALSALSSAAVHSLGGGGELPEHRALWGQVDAGQSEGRQSDGHRPGGDCDFPPCCSARPRGGRCLTRADSPQDRELPLGRHPPVTPEQACVVRAPA